MTDKRKTLKALTETLRICIAEAKQSLQAGLAEAQWVLSERDQRVLADSISTPAAPPPALIRAAKRLAKRGGTSPRLKNSPRRG